MDDVHKFSNGICVEISYCAPFATVNFAGSIMASWSCGFCGATRNVLSAKRTVAGPVLPNTLQFTPTGGKNKRLFPLIDSR
jgi:hypothetical protein